MASKPRSPRSAEPAGVTDERFTRLYRLLQLLAAAPQKRETLLRRLRLDVRKFYRDLELLRHAGITTELQKGRYTLRGDLDEAVARLPFPDPHLSVGEAFQLAKGRSAAHRSLKARIAQLMP